MRTLPVDAITHRADCVGLTRHAGTGRDALQGSVVSLKQRRVVLQAAGEGVADPVELKLCTGNCGKLVEVALRQDEGHAASGVVLDDELVLGEEITTLFLAQSQQVAVGQAVIVKQGIVTGGTQVAAQTAQHFIAEETG